MTALLDTHVLLWIAGEHRRLSVKARRFIERAAPKHELAIASITLWEIARLAANRRVTVSGTLATWLTELLASTGVAVLELTPSIVELSIAFGPDYPKDPADQIIGATSRAHGLPLITADTRLHACPLLKTVW